VKGFRVWASQSGCAWGLQVLADFRAGKFNTLVATCIGEEGLDIPQVPHHRISTSCRHAAGHSLRHACCMSSYVPLLRRSSICSKPAAGRTHSTHQHADQIGAFLTQLQVDMIVCYDASASPGRNIQRMGRTGRHGNGRVVYVLAAGKETEKYSKSLSVRPPAALLWFFVVTVHATLGCCVWHIP
jgi:Helicase conserved C-terminal domain